MNFTKSDIPDLILIEPRVFEDHRGFFMESYHYERFCENGITEAFVQDNHSKSTKGILRGLHYQLHPKAQGKLVRVSQGSVFDVAVDLRKNSTHFKQWFGIELSATNKKMLYIPPGFAHGFYVLSETAEFQYKCTENYSPEYERSLAWDDDEIGIIWPEGEKILSEKDKNNPSFILAEMNF